MGKIAVLIPCYNESKTVAKVVSDYKKALPEADVYVYDNNSTDGTAEIAAAALRVLELLGYESEATRLCREKYPDTIINDAGAVVGHREARFTF